MVRTLGVYRRAKRVIGQIQVPSQSLHDDHAEEGEYGSFLEDLGVILFLHRILVGQLEFGASFWNVVLIAFH